MGREGAGGKGETARRWGGEGSARRRRRRGERDLRSCITQLSRRVERTGEGGGGDRSRQERKTGWLRQRGSSRLGKRIVRHRVWKDTNQQRDNQQLQLDPKRVVEGERLFYPFFSPNPWTSHNLHSAGRKEDNTERGSDVVQPRISRKNLHRNQILSHQNHFIR